MTVRRGGILTRSGSGGPSGARRGLAAARATNYTRPKKDVPTSRRMGRDMRICRATAVLGGMLIISAALLSRSIVPAAAQQAPGNAPTMDELQKADKIYQFKKAAASGAERGREIFYYKCWFCHNEFTKDVPKLTGLYQRGTLLSGLPVTDENVKNRIRNGG